MELKPRRRPRVTATGIVVAVMLTIGFALWSYVVVTDALAQRDLVGGDAVPGTFHLEEREYVDLGQAGGKWVWAGRFVSDDGSVDRPIGEGPVGDDETKEAGSGRWQAGDTVPAEWVAVTPDDAYRPGSGRSYWWVQIVLGVIVPPFLVFIGLWAWWERGGGYTVEPPESTPPAAPSSPTEHERTEARVRAGRADAAHLRAELDHLQHDEIHRDHP